MVDDIDAIFGSRAPGGFAERFRPEKAAPQPGPGPAAGPGPEPASGSAPMPEPAASVYRPYATLPNDGVIAMFDIGMWMDGTNMPVGHKFPYRLLLEIKYLGSKELWLHFPDKIMILRGRHLNDLAEKLARGEVSSIIQYNPRIWPVRPESGPIVEQIEIIRPQVN